MYNWIDIWYGIGCRDIYPFSCSSTSHLLTMSSLTFYTFLCPSFIFPSFLTFTYVYLFVTFDLLLISPFLHVFYAFLLFSFLLLIFFPSQPLSSSSLLFYFFHCLLLFLPPFLSFTTFYPSFSSSFQNPSPPHPSWIHILAINNGSEIEQADKTYRQRVFFNDMLKYYHIYGMWTEYDIIHQIHQYYLE